MRPLTRASRPEEKTTTETNSEKGDKVVMQNVDPRNVDYIEPKPPVNYLTNGFTLRSWLLTKDHKRIAILYLLSVSAFFALGGIYASLIRLELLTPQSDLLESGTYNRVFTQHGIIMVFFFLIPSIPAILGNFLIPIMIGAKDLAFPKIKTQEIQVLRCRIRQTRTERDCRHRS